VRPPAPSGSGAFEPAATENNAAVVTLRLEARFVPLDPYLHGQCLARKNRRGEARVQRLEARWIRPADGVAEPESEGLRSVRKGSIEMRLFVRGIGIIAGMLGVSALALVALSEMGEVVIVRTVGAAGPRESRVWVVDGDVGPILRGAAGKEWVENARTRTGVTLRRGGEWVAYRAVEIVAPAEKARVGALMLEKYGIAERAIGLLYDLDASVAFLLRAEPPSGLSPAPR